MALRDGNQKTTPSAAPARPRRPLRDWIATGVIVVGAIALAVPVDRTEAAGPRIQLLPAVAEPGTAIQVRGTGFTRGRVTLTIDSANAVVWASAGSGGAFRIRVDVPLLSAGWHAVTATQASISRVGATSSPPVSATAVLTVVGPGDAGPPPTAAPTTSAAALWPALPSLGALPSSAPRQTATPSPTQAQRRDRGFVTADGTSLKLDGAPYRFSGFNIYNANSRWNCGGPMVDGGLDRALDDIGPGAEVFRAWFFQPLAKTGTGARDWTAFDATLAVARAHGVRVIVTLADHWGACESTGLKGEAWYTTGYRTLVHSGERVTYRDFVAEIVTRYRDDPTILMWQMVNEAESKTAAGTCSSVEVLRAFAADVGGLIQRLDPNHLVSLGTMGGGQCATQGADYRTLHALPEIDVCEVHDYWDNAPLPGDQWNGFAVRVAQCNELDKPLFVGEVGRRPQSAGGTIASRAEVFGAKFAAQYGVGVDGILLWGWRNGDEGGSAADDFDIGPGDPALVHVRAY